MSAAQSHRAAVLIIGGNAADTRTVERACGLLDVRQDGRRAIHGRRRTALGGHPVRADADVRLVLP